MLILPIKTARLTSGDDLSSILSEHVQDGDILVVSSKAVSMTEGHRWNLSTITPSEEATMLAAKARQDPSFTEAVLQETKRMHGSVVGTCPWALLTSLQPDGMRVGRILCPNAGLDQSNVEEGYAIGWPVDSVKSVAQLRMKLLTQLNDKKLQTSPHPNSSPANGGGAKGRGQEVKKIAIILSDSCCRPGRQGVSAFALTVSGLGPLQSEVGKTDLFGRTLKFTHEAIADQLAVAANAVMGNADQSIPAAIIRDHKYAFSDYEGWVEGIAPDEDLFRDVMTA